MVTMMMMMNDEGFIDIILF